MRFQTHFCIDEKARLQMLMDNYPEIQFHFTSAS